MDTRFTEEIVSIHVDFDNADNMLCPDDVVKTEYFNTDDIDTISSDGCIVQSIDSSYFTHCDEHNNELNNVNRAVMESVPYVDGLQYLAAVSSDIRHITDNVEVNIDYHDFKEHFHISYSNLL